MARFFSTFAIFGLPVGINGLLSLPTPALCRRFMSHIYVFDQLYLIDTIFIHVYFVSDFAYIRRVCLLDFVELHLDMCATGSRDCI